MRTRVSRSRLVQATAAAAVGLLLLSGFGRPLASRSLEVRTLGPPGAAARLFPRADRPVADIVAPIWGDERQRDLAKETEQLTAKLSIKPGQTLADIGAGAGYDSLRLARIVGPRGQVIAEDIQPEYLSGLLRTVRAQKLTNVVPALGEAHDPRLKPGSVDVAILIHMYHEISAPYAFLYNLAPALKPGGRVGIMDAARVTNQHGTPPELLKCEVEAVGYRLVSRTEMDGGLGYLMVFDAPAPAARPKPESIKSCRMKSPLP